MPTLRLIAWGAFGLLAACATRTDHLHTLKVLPERGVAAPAGAASDPSSPPVHVVLSVGIPAVVDRAEMVLNTPGTGIMVLDHERWVLPLSDEVSQTLARDMENLRPDILVGDRGFDRASSPPVLLKVDLVRMTALQGAGVSIEAHWRIVDESRGVDRIGSESFDASLAGAGSDAVAMAYSEALSNLAKSLTADIRSP